MDNELFTKRMNLELETLSVNQLHTLANQALALGLITGHGYRGGQYEILRHGQFEMFDPKAAIQYLQALIDQNQPPE
jgi:hypothetical protein